MTRECQQNVSDPTHWAYLPHSGKVTHRVPGYWRGEARKVKGRDLLLCEAHAKQMRATNPFQDVQEVQS
jgi:hypothetical protein